MKKDGNKHHLYKYNLYKIIPHIVWTLVFSLGYAFLASKIQQFFAIENQIDITIHYMQGLLFFFPLIMFKIGMQKMKRIGLVILLGIFVCGGAYMITGSIFFTLLTFYLWIVRLLNHLQQVEGSLDHAHELLVLAIGIFVIICGITDDVFLQKMAMYHLIFAFLLCFSYQGLCRFDEYIRILHEKANMPRKRIRDTGIKIFVTTSVLVLLWMIPMMQYQYEFIAINIPTFENVRLEKEEMDLLKAGQGSSGMGYFMNMEEEESPLKEFWVALEKITFFALYMLLIYVVIRTVYKVIVIFNQVQVEKNDTIESSIVVSDEIAKKELRKRKWDEFFDFSEEMKIRRRYKKELKKYNPKHWQTPTEMEKMAQLEIGDLHQLYEEVRYGDKSLE